MPYRTVGKGDRVSEYTLIEKLGQGGFGEVWKGEHTQIPGKFVAIKIPTSLENIECIKKEAVFQHELDHPHIVKTIGLNTDNDPPYFMMEYVDGKSLRQLMRDDGILPPPYAIDIAVQVCEALAFAHGKGIVHKDIKPENILVEKKRIDVSRKGKALLHYVKLTDLGLGKLPTRNTGDIVISENARTTGLRILSGTLFYMAPEQMVADRQVDPRADIYSVGVVLYEMLTGELPLGMDLPSELNPVVTPELDAICKRALSIDRDTRYQTATEMAAELQKAKEKFLLKLVASGAPAMEITPQGGLRRFTPQAIALGLRAPSGQRRRWEPLHWALTAAVVVSLAVAAVAFIRLGRVSRRAEEAAAKKAAPAEYVGPFTITSKPSGAEVWLDGRRVGMTPVEMGLVGFTHHQITLNREFHASRQLLLEPRKTGDRKFFSVLDKTSRKELGRSECTPGFSLESIALALQKGKVRIETPKVTEASVYVDGQFFGVTPFEIDTLDAGWHHFIISRDGYKDFSFHEKLEAGATIGKEIGLLEVGKPETSGKDVPIRIRVTSTPAGAMILANGVDRGQTPCDLELPSGDHELRLVKKYYESRLVAIKADSPKSAEFELAKVAARVSFESDPQGAAVEIDGTRVGATPLTLDGIEGGWHKATFLIAGHYPQTVDFEIVNREPVGPIRQQLLKIPPGTLTVDCEVKGAEVFLDGKLIGRVPLAPRSVDSGRHQLRVLGQEVSILLEPGAEKVAPFTLKDVKMARVPEGEFSYGTANPKLGEVYVRMEKTGGYFIDCYEVTNEQYGVFLAQIRQTGDHSRCHPDEGKTDHTPAFWEDERYNGPKHPVVGVRFYDAYAYAAWAGKRLPTEREWEKAARGKSGAIYPWGGDWDAHEARCNWGDGGKDDGYVYTAPVGSCPGVSPFGCYDMVGNVSEWCADDFAGKSGNKVVRGGSFLDKNWTTTTSRWYESPFHTSATVGFRCVIDEKK